jgi:hypothetical protein
MLRPAIREKTSMRRTSKPMAKPYENEAMARTRRSVERVNMGESPLSACGEAWGFEGEEN